MVGDTVGLAVGQHEYGDADGAVEGDTDGVDVGRLVLGTLVGTGVLKRLDGDLLGPG